MRPVHVTQREMHDKETVFIISLSADQISYPALPETGISVSHIHVLFVYFLMKCTLIYIGIIYISVVFTMISYQNSDNYEIIICIYVDMSNKPRCSGRTGIKCPCNDGIIPQKWPCWALFSPDCLLGLFFMSENYISHPPKKKKKSLIIISHLGQMWSAGSWKQLHSGRYRGRKMVGCTWGWMWASDSDSYHPVVTGVSG